MIFLLHKVYTFKHCQINLPILYKTLKVSSLISLLGPPTLSNQQVFPELSVIETGAETQVVYKPPAECSSPLWKLEEMKEQLPAVKEQSKGHFLYLFFTFNP